MLTVLFMYECLITGYEEVEFFWKARWTGATALFLANRYFSLGWYIYNIIGSLAMFAPKARTLRPPVCCPVLTDSWPDRGRKVSVTCCRISILLTTRLQLCSPCTVLPGRIDLAVPPVGG